MTWFRSLSKCAFLFHRSFIKITTTNHTFSLIIIFFFSFFHPIFFSSFVRNELQVCEENRCQEEVFILALNYMDRFLALTHIPRTQLQILAAACLLIASKLREPSVRGLPADILVFYTDNSITRRDLTVSKPDKYFSRKSSNPMNMQ